MRNEIIISVPARNERKTALVAADDAFYKTSVFGAVKSAVDVDDNAVVFKPTQNILYRATLKRRFRAGFGENRLFTDPRPFAIIETAMTVSFLNLCSIVLPLFLP